MSQRIQGTKFYFCGAYLLAPKNSHIFVAHPHDMHHRILKNMNKIKKIHRQQNAIIWKNSNI
jgi:hypothetical protein